MSEVSIGDRTNCPTRCCADNGCVLLTVLTRWKCLSVLGLLILSSLIPAMGTMANHGTSADKLKAEADELFDRGQYRRAAAAYDRLAKGAMQDKELQAYARFRQGLARLKDGRKSEAFTAWAELRLFHPNSEFVRPTLLLEAENTTNPIRSEKLYDEILTKFPQSMEAATILIKRGQAACDRKDYITALRLWRQFLEAFPQDPSVTEIQARLETVELALEGKEDSAATLEAEALVQRADALFDRVEYAKAARLYAVYLDRFSQHEFASLVAGRLAECQQALGKDQEALRTLQRLLDRSPKDASVILGEIVVRAANSGRGALRERATQELLNKYPNSFEAEQAVFIAGSLEMIRKNQAGAKKWWGLLLERYPQTVYRAAVEKQLGILDEENQKHSGKTRKTAFEEKREREQRKEEERRGWEQEALQFARHYQDIRNIPDYRAQSLYEWAERSFYLQNYNVAAQLYQRVWTEFPHTEWAGMAAFRAAQVCFTLGDDGRGTEHLQLVVNRFPSSELRPVALFCLGNRKVLYEADLKGAWNYYDRLVEEYPDHPLSAQARGFWSKVTELPPQKLKEQVAEFVKQQRRR